MAKKLPARSTPGRPHRPPNRNDGVYWNDDIRKALGHKMGPPELVDDPSFNREDWSEGVIETDIESMFEAKNSRRTRPARVPKR